MHGKRPLYGWSIPMMASNEASLRPGGTTQSGPGPPNQRHGRRRYWEGKLKPINTKTLLALLALWAHAGAAFAAVTAVAPALQLLPSQLKPATRAVDSAAWDHGADATGSSDTTATLQAALNGMAGGGGRFRLVGKFRIDTDLNVPVGVTIEGDCLMPGSPGNNTTAPYAAMNCGVLMIAPQATVRLASGAGLKSLFAFRADMVFPAPNSAQFAGTAITAAGDDVSVDRVLVAGFHTAFVSDGFQRTRIAYLYGDNLNGIEIARSFDIASISHATSGPLPP